MDRGREDNFILHFLSSPANFLKVLTIAVTGTRGV
jgi:hypothetical protein